MGLRIFLLAAVLLAATGCSAAPPPKPTAADTAVLMELQLDTVWDETGLDDALRPEVQPAASGDRVDDGFIFAGCMMNREWSGYMADTNSATYRSLSEATSDGERRDWYACYAAHPATGALASIAQYDYVYDYYQDVLIPCLRGNGFAVDDAPTRNEFRTSTGPNSFMFIPIVWNPYYLIEGYSGPGSLPVEEKCPATPPNQDFYVM